MIPRWEHDAAAHEYRRRVDGRLAAAVYYGGGPCRMSLIDPDGERYVDERPKIQVALRCADDWIREHWQKVPA